MMDSYAAKEDRYATKAQISESTERSNGSAISREMAGIESQSAQLLDMVLKLSERLAPILKPELPRLGKDTKADNIGVPMAQALSNYNNQLARTRDIVGDIMSRIDL